MLFRSNVEVRTEFISEEEESAFMKELEQGLRKKRYEFDHWDDVSSCMASWRILPYVFLQALHCPNLNIYFLTLTSPFSTH